VQLAGDTAIDLSAFAITTDVTIRGNAAGITIQRSAIGPEMRLFRVTTSGSLTLESITLAGGFVRGEPGSAPNGAGGEARGGAVFNQGTLRIIASTLVSNEVRGGDGIGSGVGGGAKGGAIYNDAGTVSIVNVTLSGNVAQSGGGLATSPNFAAGVYSRNGTLKIDNSTITNNVATAGRGVYAVATAGSATVEIYSSIIGQAEASPTIFDLVVSTDDGGALSIAGANNLIRRQNDFPQITFSNDDPLLGPLVNNGGSTQTHALADSSPAMNHGGNRLLLPTDQRGALHTRVVGGQADIGAFEVQTATGPSLPGDYNKNQAVDAADYVVWRKTLGTFAVNLYAGADGDGNGRIETQDYNLWRARFGAIGGAAAQLVMPASSSAEDSSPAPTAAEPVDVLSPGGAVTIKVRSLRTVLVWGSTPSETRVGRSEMLNLIVENAFSDSTAEDLVWEGWRFQASEGMADHWDVAGFDSAMHAAFESFGSVNVCRPLEPQ
jgi:hypothetical protein